MKTRDNIRVLTANRFTDQEIREENHENSRNQEIVVALILSPVSDGLT